MQLLWNHGLSSASQVPSTSEKAIPVSAFKSPKVADFFNKEARTVSIPLIFMQCSTQKRILINVLVHIQVATIGGFIVARGDLHNFQDTVRVEVTINTYGQETTIMAYGDIAEELIKITAVEPNALIFITDIHPSSYIAGQLNTKKNV